MQPSFTCLGKNKTRTLQWALCEPALSLLPLMAPIPGSLEQSRWLTLAGPVAVLSVIMVLSPHVFLSTRVFFFNSLCNHNFHVFAVYLSPIFSTTL